MVFQFVVAFEAEGDTSPYTLTGGTFGLVAVARRIIHFFPIDLNTLKFLTGHKYITVQEAEPFRITFGGPGVLLFLEGLEERKC